MAEVKKIYYYFDRLEKRIRIALAFFIFLLFLGSFIIGVGFDRLLHFGQSSHPQLLVLVSLAALMIILALMFNIGKISWLGKLHLRLDRYLFGFLQMSNEAILRSLLFALKPEERSIADKLEPGKQNATAQSIFSALSSDSDLFEIFLETKIFRNWTIYWIMVYSTLTYSLLTIISFIFALVNLDPYAKMLFNICWLLAAFHLGIVIPLGRRLVTLSKRVVDTMVEIHKHQIAKMLRENMYEEEEAEEADIISDDELG